MTFIKKVEDFVCENCGAKVTGDGFTNHCPRCLWSKHVDVDPGDRASACGGLMEPINLEKKGERFIITHRCTRCFHESKNRVHKKDDPEALVELSVKIAEKNEEL